MFGIDSMETLSPRWHARHQQNDGELKQKDQYSASKRRPYTSELSCSLAQEVQHLEKGLNEQFAVRHALEKALGYKPCVIHLSKDSCIPKSTEELIKEIGVLELEVICLEQNLLSLYRKAFEQQICSTVSACDMERNRQSARLFSSIHPETSALDFSTPKKQQLVQSSRMILARKSTPATRSSEASISQHNVNRTSIVRSHSTLLQRTICSARVCPSANNLARAHTSPLSFVEEGKCKDSVIVSLADILGTRIADHVPQTPNKISEDMIKCIAAIYIRLRDVTAIQRTSFPSPCSSFSSTSGISSKLPENIWSPRCRKESFMEAWRENSFGSSKSRELSQQYDSVFEVSALCKGAHRSSDVKDMLCKYKSLVQLLETVDFSGAKDEEKLAFWINVHNAMMMHAHIEYGIPESNSKRLLLAKVPYIISGQRVNVELIEHQILCCRVPCSGQWFRLLMYPKWKPKVSEELQGFAVDRPEPLVHFALSSGSHSDPVVRQYSPKRLHEQLVAAKEEFIRANTGVRGSSSRRVVLPKLLESYARDAGLGSQDLLRVVESCLPESALRDAARQCRSRPRRGGGVDMKPRNMAFRYVLSQELVVSPPATGAAMT